MSVFEPFDILEIYSDFDMDYYRGLGYDTVLIDVDNTIAIPNTGKCDDHARKFIEELKENGFHPVIFSNNNRKRVEYFVGDMDVDYCYYSVKPLPFAYKKACKKFGTKPERTLVLGDQLITDILGANLSGCTGIYCKQLQEKDSPMTAFNRKIEKFIWRNVLHEEV